MGPCTPLSAVTVSGVIYVKRSKVVIILILGYNV